MLGLPNASNIRNILPFQFEGNIASIEVKAVRNERGAWSGAGMVWMGLKGEGRLGPWLLWRAGLRVRVSLGKEAAVILSHLLPAIPLDTPTGSAHVLFLINWTQWTTRRGGKRRRGGGEGNVEGRQGKMNGEGKGKEG